MADTVYQILNTQNPSKTHIKGWITQHRNSKNIGFLEVNDGSTIRSVQIVYRDSLENFDELKTASLGSAVEIWGNIVITNRAHKFEIAAEKIFVLAHCDSDYPIQKKEMTPEFLRSVAHLRSRSKLYQTIFSVRSKIAAYIHQFFLENGFYWVASPIITSNDTEGAGETFALRDESLENKSFFNKTAYLTVSGQLTAEAYALTFKKVYTFGPTFRAENSNTTRHAAEFWMIEPEIAFADLTENMNVIERLIKFVVKHYLANCHEEISYFEDNLDSDLTKKLKVISANKEFACITYTQAIKILQTALKKGVKFKFSDLKWGADLQTEHERFLCEKYFNAPLFVKDYPRNIKAFYMKVNPDKKTVAAADLLLPKIGELVGGSQREDDFKMLQEQMGLFKIKEADLGWYLNLRRYGYARSAGFGLGLERLIMYLTGVSNIRDVIPFPRTSGSLSY